MVEEVTVTGVRSSGPGMPVGTVSGGSLGGSRGYSPGQSEGQDAKAATQRKRECEKQKNLDINAAKLTCMRDANTFKAEKYSSCPPEESIETEIDTGVGRVNVKTTPRKTCTDNVDVAFEGKVSGCNADAATSASKINAECR